MYIRLEIYYFDVYIYLLNISFNLLFISFSLGTYFYFNENFIPICIPLTSYDIPRWIVLQKDTHVVTCILIVYFLLRKYWKIPTYMNKSSNMQVNNANQYFKMYLLCARFFYIKHLRFLALSGFKYILPIIIVL